jgi:hypothetical protein
MSPRSLLALLFLAVCLVLAAPTAKAVISVHAFYRLGDDDPGAVAGNLGDDPTKDSGGAHLDLTRRGLPTYSSDVPANVRLPDTLSMDFNNNPAIVGPGPVADAGYYTTTPLSFPLGRWGVEAWVKPAVADYTAGTGYSLITYNGNLSNDPTAASGIGLFQKGNKYVVRIGTREKVLGPVVANQWTHLAFVRRPLLNSFFFNGVEVPDSTPDAQSPPIDPTLGTGFIAVGTLPPGAAFISNSFWGKVDEVRFFSFAPPPFTGAAEVFNPATDLDIVPEPAAIATAFCAVGFSLVTRRRRTRR